MYSSTKINTAQKSEFFSRTSGMFTGNTTDPFRFVQATFRIDIILTRTLAYIALTNVVVVMFVSHTRRSFARSSQDSRAGRVSSWRDFKSTAKEKKAKKAKTLKGVFRPPKPKMEQRQSFVVTIIIIMYCMCVDMWLCVCVRVVGRCHSSCGITVVIAISYVAVVSSHHFARQTVVVISNSSNT